jgi:hypothetical protein
MKSKSLKRASKDFSEQSINCTSRENSIFEERQAAWKVFLPLAPKMPILAIGLSKNILVNLARSWTVVHAYGIPHHDIQWAIQQIERLGLISRIIEIKSLESVDSTYCSIAINVESQRKWPFERTFYLLAPGGAVVWIGRNTYIPSANNLLKQDCVRIRKYAILPPHGFRIIVPLNHGRLTHTGLGLFVPGRASNRLAVYLARLISIAGCQELLGLRQVVVTRKGGLLSGGSYFLDWVSQQLNLKVSDATVFPGNNYNVGVRKLTLQLLDKNGQVIGIAKLADMEGARKAIEREALALKRLENISELRPAIPKIITQSEWHRHAVQVQTAVGPVRKTFCKNLRKEHLEFLARLSQVDQIEMPLEKWPHWPKMWHWAHNSKFTSPNNIKPVSALVEKCAHKLKDLRIPFHRIHGDFARWNVLFGENKLSIVDWEQSDSMGLPCYDLVYFLVRKPYLDRTKDGWAELYLSDSLTLLKENTTLLNTFIESHSSPALRRFNYESIEALASLCACTVIREVHTRSILADCQDHK